MAATKAQLMTDIRENLATAGYAFDHFEAGATDLDAVCAGLVEFLANEVAAGGVVLADGDYGDVVISSSGTVFTIDADAVTNAKLAEVATATFKGRNTAGTGNPEDLTVTQATALLNAATATVKGMVPTPPNNTTTFLRGDATFAAPKQRVLLTWGVDTVTAGTTGVFLNGAGMATTPASTTIQSYVVPFTGNIVAVHFHMNVIHTTNTVDIRIRLEGVLTTIYQIPTTESRGIVAPSVGNIAVTAGQSVCCAIDHNGATNVRRLFVSFELEF